MEFKYAPMFQLGKDETEYYLLTKDYVSVGEFEGHEMLKVEPEGLTLMAQQAFHDVSFMLRRSHNEQVAKILRDPEASANDKYVALTFLRNADVACKGQLPLCQDTGTAIIHGEKGQQVWTSNAAHISDEEALSRGVFNTYTQDNLRYSQNAPLDMYNEAVMDAFYEFYNVQKAFVDGQVNGVTVHSVETNAQNQTPGDMSSSTLIGMCDIKLLKSEILYDSVFFVWLEIIPDGDDYMYEIQSDVSGMRSTMKDSSSGKEVIDENMQAKFNVTLSRSSKDPVNWQSIRIIDSRFRQRGDDVTEDYRTVLRTVTDTDTSVGLSSTR